MKNLQYLIKFKPHQRELFQSAATHVIPSIIFRMLKEASKWQKQKQKQKQKTKIVTDLNLLHNWTQNVFTCSKVPLIIA